MELEIVKEDDPKKDNVNDDLEFHEVDLESSRKKVTKRIRSRKFGRNAFRYFQSFSENASIDGLKFVGEEGRTLVERIFWTTIVVVGLILSVIMIYQTFVKWWNFPVVVTFATSATPISEIPFPAITICPQIKVDKNKFNYTDYYIKMENKEEFDDSNRTIIDILSLVCDPDEIYDKKALYIDNDSVQSIAEMAPQLEEVITQVEWRGQEILNISEYFFPVLTSEGVCFTFNGVGKDDMFTEHVQYPEGFYSNVESKPQWSLENGYEKDAGIDVFPRKTIVAGIRGGLSVFLVTPKDSIDYVCGDAVQGFKVAIHHPFEMTRLKQNYILVPLDQTVVAALKPQILTTSDELKGYDPKYRSCYFEEEKKLRYFKHYDQRNCLTECLTNYTYHSCGCAGFNMPQNVSTPICSIASKRCMDRAKIRFLKNDIDHTLQDQSVPEVFSSSHPIDTNKKGMEEDDCHCLPSCFYLDYDVETSQADWNWTEIIKIGIATGEMDQSLGEFVIGENGYHLSQLQVYFKEMQYITAERNELYGYVDFWANVGGIIGLFTGFSFITMFEILYYLSLRLVCNVRMFGRKNWAGAPQETDDNKDEDEQ